MKMRKAHKHKKNIILANKHKTSISPGTNDFVSTVETWLWILNISLGCCCCISTATSGAKRPTASYIRRTGKFITETIIFRVHRRHIRPSGSAQTYTKHMIKVLAKTRWKDRNTYLLLFKLNKIYFKILYHARTRLFFHILRIRNPTQIRSQPFTNKISIYLIN